MQAIVPQNLERAAAIRYLGPGSRDSQNAEMGDGRNPQKRIGLQSLPRGIKGGRACSGAVRGNAEVVGKEGSLRQGQRDAGQQNQ